MALVRAEEFFAFARKRHQIYLDRKMGKPYPWTDDWILRDFSFTNVYRELDKVTVWFREHVREPMRDKPEVLLATVVFRWFNRPNVGHAIFDKGYYEDGDSVWDQFLRDGDIAPMKDAILTACGSGPYVNGAYIILGTQGMSKLDGVLNCIQTFNDLGCAARGQYWPQVAERSLASPTSLEWVWDWLRQYPYLGDFMSYEIVTDLRHTDLFCDAPDIMTWANPGPGAARGLARITGRGVKGRWIEKSIPKAAMIMEMRELLALSQQKTYWPNSGLFPKLEMREIEHTLCEFDKYERTVTGDGTPKTRFKYRGK